MTLAGTAGTALAVKGQARLDLPSDEATVAHVLSRVTFGPRPGDVERVQRMGLGAYLERQLHPERIDDSAMAARLDGFRTLELSTRELADQYFLPALMERERRKREQADRGDESGAPGAATGPRGIAAGPPPAEREPRRMSEAMQNERLVLAELGQQKILRAVYSERQLQEVMVDFWFNHFNVFAGKGPARQYLTDALLSRQLDEQRPRPTRGAGGKRGPQVRAAERERAGPPG